MITVDSEMFAIIFADIHTFLVEASVAEQLSYLLYKPGVLSLIPGFSSLSVETLNRGPVSIWP